MEYKSPQDSMNVDTFIKVIASSRLSIENQKWLTLLSSHLNKDDAKRIILQMGNLTEKDEKAYSNSVVQYHRRNSRPIGNPIGGSRGSGSHHKQ